MKIHIIFYFLFAFLVKSYLNEPSSNIPKNCQKKDYHHISGDTYKWLTCSIKRNSRLEFNVTNSSMNKSTIWIKQDNFESKTLILNRNSLDLNSLIRYINSNKMQFYLKFQSIKGFDLDLFDMNKLVMSMMLVNIEFVNCNFEFYIGERKLKSCQDFYYDEKNSLYIFPKSIFQLGSTSQQGIFLYLSGSKSPICPLVFKNTFLYSLHIHGQNSYFSQRMLRFSNETLVFRDLNSFVFLLQANIDNIELDLRLLNPSVFDKLAVIVANGRVKSIDPEIFVSLKRLKNVNLEAEYVRGLMHNERGIEWIKSINRGLNINFSNQIDMKQSWGNVTYLYLDCIDMTKTPHMSHVFLDEDFCLYKDYPFDQLVFLAQICQPIPEHDYYRKKLSCTYLWLIQHYPDYEQCFDENFSYKDHIRILTQSNEFKSMSKCNFTSRLEMCNRSNYVIKPAVTYFEIGERMVMIKTIINILSYPIAIFGFVTNLLVVITISSKKSKDDFKEYKQYNYMRINSICNCLILIIHFISWLTDCVYPYQVFCPEIRKSLFFQYVKIVIVEVFGTSLRFMNHFSYIAFAFNRISLIGKDHNKLVKFVSDVGIKKYTSVCLLISIGLSVVKFFSYRINEGEHNLSYPFQYDYILYNSEKNSSIYFILNFVSDLLNYIILFFVTLSIDIGMIVKLRQTLNEKMEKAKTYITKEQQEKKKKENETVVNNAILMVILNTAFGIFLKLPTLIYSIFNFYQSIYRLNSSIFFYKPGFGRFYKRFCSDAKFCPMFLSLADILFSISLSIQLFFFIHFDKKFKTAFDRIFFQKKK